MSQHRVLPTYAARKTRNITSRGSRANRAKSRYFPNTFYRFDTLLFYYILLTRSEKKIIAGN